MDDNPLGENENIRSVRAIVPFKAYAPLDVIMRAIMGGDKNWRQYAAKFFGVDSSRISQMIHAHEKETPEERLKNAATLGQLHDLYQHGRARCLEWSAALETAEPEKAARLRVKAGTASTAMRELGRALDEFYTRVPQPRYAKDNPADHGGWFTYRSAQEWWAIQCQNAREDELIARRTVQRTPAGTMTTVAYNASFKYR